jgi:hypothetical protein
VKTGGSSVTKYFEAAAPQANFSYYSVAMTSPSSRARGTDTPETYHYADDPEWTAMKNEAYHTRRPRIVTVLHNGVPGVGDSLWNQVHHSRFSLSIAYGTAMPLPR